MGRSRGRSRGVAPIIIGIAAIIFGAVAAFLWAFTPEIANFLLGALGGEEGVYFFLVEIPTADVNAPGTMTAPITNVFELLRNVALVFFAVVLVIAGLCYALESFRIVGQGTAASIVTGSVFTALMIFLFLPIYNVVAGLFNTLTSPDQGYILSPGMISSLIQWAIQPPPSANIGEQALSFFMSVFFLVMVAITLIAVAILGILRIFFIGAVAAMMPIVLVLRLIPLTRRIADSFIDMLVGLMLSSLVAAVFLRFGYEVLSIGSFTGLAGTVVAWGTLIAAAMMPTVLAPRLGSLFMTTAGMVTAAVSTATIGTVGTLAGTAAGVALGAKAVTGPGAAGLTGRQKAIGFLRTVGYAAGPFMTGALTGKFAGAIPTVGGVPSLGGAAAAASASRAQTASHVNRLLEKRAGTVTEALMSALPFVKASPLASEADGLAWKKRIAEMSDEEAGKFFRESFPELKLLERYNGNVGKAFKSTVAKASPITVSSMIAHLKDMKENKTFREAFIKKALEEFSENKERLRANGYPVPDIMDEADATPTFMRGIFRHGGETARIVNAKLFHGALHHYDSGIPLEEARKAAGNFVKKVTTDKKTGAKLPDEKVAEELSKLVGINNMSAEEKKAFGYAARRYLTTLEKDSPRILAAAWKAVNDPKWSERVKSEGYTEAALKSVESGELPNRLTSLAFADFRETLAGKVARAAAEEREREIRIREGMRMLFESQDGGGHERKRSGYIPPRPRKRSEKIAEGFGGEFSASLEKYMKERRHGEE